MALMTCMQCCSQQGWLVPICIASLVPSSCKLSQSAGCCGLPASRKSACDELIVATVCCTEQPLQEAGQCKPGMTQGCCAFLTSVSSVQVQRLRDAGAVVLGKSNMAEWAFCPDWSVGSAFGVVRNPYNLNHFTGGSSGGTAAGKHAVIYTVVYRQPAVAVQYCGTLDRG